ncbi:MAG: TIGR03936 family radical SAM-associated protein [Chloroflexi bacterium]|nr:TIGR03936 family radical SAM-associated protein [Chloroflexota bacterium]
MKRLRITFSKGEELKYISHLDLMRAWERLLRRAGVPLAYSKGFNPHPKVSVAAPLPIGVSGEAELMDVFVEGEETPARIREMMEPQLPRGLRVVDVREVSAEAPSLQSELRFSDYEVDLATPLSREAVESRVKALLAASSIERERQRDREVRRYDLRPLIDDIWIAEWNGGQKLAMRLRADVGGAGRPDEVLAALGLEEYVKRIRRTGLVLEERG